MARLHISLSSFAALVLSLSACNSAYADRLAPAPLAEKAIARTPAESPYQVDLLGENGQTLDVYQHRGRFYVLGSVGERYTIRVSNPTSRRIEALVSVDGLDVIDGQSANLGKRGYVVPPGGELRVDGFRVSTQQVATFRFSSVSRSYAGRKGKARNVGVIGVAIFEEQAPQEIIISKPTPRPRPNKDWRKRDYDFREDLEADAGDDVSTASAESRPAPPPRVRGQGSTSGVGGLTAGGGTRSAKVPASTPARKVSTKRSDEAPARERGRRCCGESKRKTRRPGLGTEFGERRQSAVSWTRFVRANAKVPTAMAELRYNNEAGLTALGIRVKPAVDANELQVRETANPFPGGFAQPPR